MEQTTKCAPLQVGYGRRDITPAGSVPLGGYGNSHLRLSENVLDPLYATAVAITDEKDTTVIFITTDSLVPHYVGGIREEISQTTGVPMDCILDVATHCHSSPDMDQGKFETIQAYKDVYIQGHIQAALDAMADRKPARMFYGTTCTRGLNFVRHYLMEDGSYAGDNFGDWNLKPVKNACEVDPSLHLLRFVREGEKDILVMNWRAHASMTGGSRKPDISADFVGGVRMYLEEKLDCRFAYYQGCAGNVNPRSRIPEDTPTADYIAFGKLLGEAALEALAQETELPPCHIKTTCITLAGRVNHTEDHLAEAAKQVKAFYTESGSWTEAKKMAVSMGMRNPFHASGIVRKAALPDSFDLNMYAVAFGEELAIVTGQNELFSECGQYVVENSPFPRTVVFGYTNGQRGYMPSKFAWSYTCYESDTTRFAPGVAEEIADVQLELLNKLK